jgi:hypothetical protein
VSHVSFPEGWEAKMKEPSEWEDFRNEVLHAIADNRAPRGSRIPYNTAAYCAAKEGLIQHFLTTLEGTENSNVRSFSYVLARQFITELQNSYAEPDIENIESETVETIMKRPYKPLLQAYAEVLYYIVGCLLKASHSEGTRRQQKGTLLTAWADRNSLSKEAVEKARELGSLPLQMTSRRDKGGLRYPNFELYKAMVKVERIYEALLTDDNLVAFGPAAVERVRRLVLRNDAIRASLAVAVGKSAAGVDTVVDYVLKTFGRIRGSDYAKKLLARTGKSYETATRTDLQVRSLHKKQEGPSTASTSHSSKQEDTTAFDDDDAMEIECMAGLDELASSRMEEDAQFLFRDEMDGAASDNDDFEEYDSSSSSSSSDE